MTWTRVPRRRFVTLGSLLGLAACAQGRLRSAERDPEADDAPAQSGAGDEGPVRAVSTPLPPGQAPSGGAGRLDLVGLKVTLDVGHAYRGNDTSAQGNGLVEHTQVRRQSAVVAQRLRGRGADVLVRILEFADVSALPSRGRAAAGSTVLVSLHHNSFGRSSVQGTEVLVDSRRGRLAADTRLARTIHGEMLKALWSGATHVNGSKVDRGVKDHALSVLRNTPASVEACCLTEPYFVSGWGARENGRDWTDRSGRAIADGIAGWYLTRGTGAAYLVAAPHEERLDPPDPIDAEIYRGH